MRLCGMRRRGGFRDYIIKGLLFGLPITWFVFALEMTVLSQDKQGFNLAASRADQGHEHQPAQDFGADNKLPNPLDAFVGDDSELGSRQEVIRRGIQEEGVPPGKKKIYRQKRRPSPRPPLAPQQPRDGAAMVVEEDLGPVVNDNAGGLPDNSQVRRRFDPPNLGEEGTAVVLDPNTLTYEKRAVYDQGYKNHNFNEYASDLVSIQRTVPDYSPRECRKNDYFHGAVRLETVSVIMCFYNEAWSALLRSVHSVLDRSPPHLLHELIIVDDFSDAEHLKTKLDQYMANFPKVKILRMPERVGLVRARLKGVESSQAPILIFLDSHIECAEGWMEPLVYEVSKNSTVAVTPIIDIIDKDSMAVVQAVESVGVVDIRHMTFIWSRLTPRIQRLRPSPGQPFLSPTMAGGLFAINKEFFMQLGTWDPGLVLWGGENLELSFKLWMCGGAILIHPCSRVSHIFRDKSPYLKNDVDRIVKGNAARVAEVWLDDYKRFFFHNQPYNANTYGDVSGRKQLRQVLACHTFQWYIDNVYPELFIDGMGEYVGRIKSSSGLCLTYKDESRRELMLTADCPMSISWQTSRTHEIRHVSTCLEQYQNQIFGSVCDSQETTQAFQVTFHQGDESTITHVSSGMCLTAEEMGSTGTAVLGPCLYGDRRQIWHFPKNSPRLL